MDQSAILGLTFPDDAKPSGDVQSVSEERRAVYARLLPELKSGELKGVVCDLDGEKVQHIVHAGASGPTVVVVEEGCKIMLEDLSPSQMVEYRFAESPDWYLGFMSEGGMEGYRALKFKTWKDMIDQPSCEAAFKRMLQSGLVTKLYDTVALPTPESDLSAWMVTNEDTGKPIHVPHPVEEMRIWDAEEVCVRE